MYRLILSYTWKFTLYSFFDTAHIGICRFLTESGALRALSASEKGSLLIKGKTPHVYIITPLIRDRPDICRRAFSETHISIAKPTLNRQRSHQRNTVTIDSLFESPGDFVLRKELLDLDNESSVVTPDSSSSFLRPNVFTNIPARMTPTIFESSRLETIEGPGFGKGPNRSPEHQRFSPTSMAVRE